MKANRYIALILSLLLSVSLLSACGSDSSDSSSSDSSDSASVSYDAEIEEQIIYNGDDFVVTATDLEDHSSYVILTLEIQNNTDKNVAIMLLTEGVIVNGFSIDSSMYEDINAGETVSTDIQIDRETVELSGITTIMDIEFALYAMNDDYDTIWESGWLTLETSDAGTETQNYDDSGDVVYDDKDIKIVYQGTTTSEDGDLDVLFYVENNTGQNIRLMDYHDYINGERTYYVLISNDIVAVDSVAIVRYEILIDQDDELPQSLSKLESVDFSFVIYDNDTNSSIVSSTEAPISLSF